MPRHVKRIRVEREWVRANKGMGTALVVLGVRYNRVEYIGEEQEWTQGGDSM